MINFGVKVPATAPSLSPASRPLGGAVLLYSAGVRRTSAAVAPWRMLTLPVAALLVVALFAWLAVVALADGMAGMSGTMGLDLVSFVGLWTLMMAAMMLPTIAPFVALYSRTFVGRRGWRTGTLAAGYLGVWAAAAFPAYLAVWSAEQALLGHSRLTLSVTVGVMACCGLYQLSPVKERCLRHCRAPLGLTLRYSAYTGRWRELRVGVHHGAYCL